MAHRTIVIGANRGIGLELVRALWERGDTVVATCRSSSKALAELAAQGPVQVHEGVEVTDPSTLEPLTASLAPGSVDWLVVVSGILEPGGLQPLERASIERQFAVNALGPLSVVSSLHRTLHPGSKVGLLTSRMGSIEDNTSGGSYGYRMSKAALNMAGRSLAHDLLADQIAVALLHPGWVRTEMTGGTGHLDAAESARGLIARLDELTLERSGAFLHQSGEELPW